MILCNRSEDLMEVEGPSAEVMDEYANITYLLMKDPIDHGKNPLEVEKCLYEAFRFGIDAAYKEMGPPTNKVRQFIDRLFRKENADG